MIRLPPSSTRTDALFPSTTLVRSRQDRLRSRRRLCGKRLRGTLAGGLLHAVGAGHRDRADFRLPHRDSRRHRWRSEEHTSELQSLMRISYAVFCLKKKKPDERTSTIMTLMLKSHQVSSIKQH